MHSAVHVDLQRLNGRPYPVTDVTLLLNKFFVRQNLQIRIHGTELVPDTFHARYSAKSRTYLYRLAVTKREPPSPPEEKRPNIYVPIEEIDRCYFVL